MIEYAVVFESAPNEEGAVTWGAYVPDLPGCYSCGATFEECQGMIREAIELHLEGLRAEGMEIPAPKSRVGMVEVAA